MEMQVEQKRKEKQFVAKGKVAVIGSGLVGKSWAIVFARSGYEVNLFDAIPGFAEKSLPGIEAIATELHKFGLLRSAGSASEVMKLIHPVEDLKAALNGVQYVQECTPENVDSKRKVFQELDAVAAPNIILASSSSAIPPSAFTGECAGKQRCLVVHPVNPPHLIPLVEIVPSPSTSEEIVTKSRSFMEEVGQKPIVVKKEIDSFILNRLQGAVLNEAFKLVQEGYISPQDLDTTMKDGLGLRWSFMGPFETIDLNAPGGVKDYIERYSPNMYNLAQQQAVAKKWEGEVVDEVVNARRSIMNVEDLPKRSQWRDHRLMELISQKNRLDAAESNQ